MASGSQGPTVITIAVIFGVMTLIAVVLRLWARIFLVKHMGFDDSQSSCSTIAYPRAVIIDDQIQF